MASKESTMKQKNDTSDLESNLNKNKPNSQGRGKKACEMKTRDKKKDKTMKDPIDLIFNEKFQ